MNATKKMKQKLSFLTKADILVLFVLFFVISLRILSVKVFFQKDTYLTVELIASGGEWWWGVPPPYFWNIEPIKKGIVEYDVLKRPLVEIVDVVKHDQDNRSYVWMKARLRVRKNKLTGKYLFRQSEVHIGKMINIYPNNVSIVANVVGIEGINQFNKESPKLIALEWRRIEPWRADAIQVGDTMKDSNGKIIAEVLEKKAQVAEESTTDYLGNILVSPNPLRRDVFLKMKIQTTESEGRFFFSFYQKLETGLELFIPLSKTSLHAVVTSVE